VEGGDGAGVSALAAGGQMIAVSLATLLFSLTSQLPEADPRLFVPRLEVLHLPTEGRSDPWPIEVFAGDRVVHAQRVVQTWSITAARGLRVHVAAIVVYELQSGRAWHSYLSSSYPIDRVAVDRDEFPSFRLAMDESALIGFQIRSSRLCVRRSEERSASLEAAVTAAVARIERDLQEESPATVVPNPPQFVEIDLYRLLGEWARAGQHCGSTESFPVTITKLTPIDGNWHLDLRNGEGTSATLILTSDFQVNDVSVDSRRSE